MYYKKIQWECQEFDRQQNLRMDLQQPPYKAAEGVASPRLSPMDDSNKVSPPATGGTSHFWSLAWTLDIDMKERLRQLLDDYAKDNANEDPKGKSEGRDESKNPGSTDDKPTNYDDLSNPEIVERLMNHYHVDSKAVEDVKDMCWRSHYVAQLQQFPPYYDAVITLWKRMNFWLLAWRTHMEHKDNYHQVDPAQAKADARKHLETWLDEVDNKLPKYPKDLPLYLKSGGPLLVPGMDANMLLPKPEPRPEPSPLANPRWQPEESGKGPYMEQSVLDSRTPSRKSADDRKSAVYPSYTTKHTPEMK